MAPVCSFSLQPITSANFQVEFEFKVEGKGDGLYGDGFAVWLTKERESIGPVFGNKDYFEGVGIFFDTYANSRQSVSSQSLYLCFPINCQLFSFSL